MFKGYYIWEKWFQTMKLSWSYHMSYRLNFILQVLGPVLVFYFIKINLWRAIFQDDYHLVINNYSLAMMMSYHSWAMIVELLGTGHAGTNLSEDIRLGRISSYLIYPIQFWEFHTAQFLAFQVLQFIIGGIFISFMVFADVVSIPSFAALVNGAFYIFCVSLFWYVIQFFTGLMAFYLDETWIFRVLIQLIVAFFSGLILPLEFFPEWFREIVFYTPFPYLSYYPIKIFMGEMVFSLKYPLVLMLWIIPVLFINKIIWRRGIKTYTAAGM